MTVLVAWKEGMALSQQHLQQSDKFFLRHIKNTAGLPKGMNFGFSKISLEEELIKEGQFAFKECEAVFPSGISFMDNENRAVKIEARNFTQTFDKNLNSLDVFLALDLSKSRFKVVWENLPDLYFEESFAQMPICIPMPALVFKGESLDGKEYIQVARLLRNAQNSFEIDKNFYPPLLYTGSYEYFAQKLRYFDMLLQGRIDGISHSKELLLRDLKSLKAMLGCLQNTEATSPFMIFCEICRFLQEAFNYSHIEFDKSFNKIFTALNEFLLSEKKAAFLQKRMQKEGHTFFAYIKELGESGAKELWLAVESKLSPEEAIKFMPTQLKIAPKSKLSSIVVSATHGINCVHSITPKTIQEIPGAFYFKLASDSKLWKDLCEESEMGIYAPIALQISSIDVLISTT
ncbi:MAG: type VI secretion system baseplate subunit TssK [Fibromonadaceae bacterium]|jgi:type VI secretion system protein ImpJ|nr:type VI secretion system baseplate subunit TssK [Fibromonadaceae bacterium]